MSFVCEISGQVPTDPVVTPEGHLYERRLIEEHLEKAATCPITGNPLSKKDLIALKHSGIKRPSSVILGDVGDLLGAVQKQFDLLSIENLRLHKERDEARMQITNLLYLRDGSTRAVAQKIEEIDLLKRQLEEAQQKVAQAESTGTLEPAAKKARTAIDIEATTQKWTELQKSLLAARKQRTLQFRNGEQLKTECKESDSYKAPEGTITAFEVAMAGVVDPTKPKMPAIVALGTDKGHVLLVNWQTKAVLATLSGHEGPITAIRCLLFPSESHLAPSALSALRATSSSAAPFKSAFIILTAGEDGTVRYWKDETHNTLDDLIWLTSAPTVRGSGRFVDLKDAELVPKELKLSCAYVFQVGDGPVTDLELHPSGTHAAVCTNSDGWTVLDIAQCAIAWRMEGVKEQSHVKCLAFQPDGMVAVGATQRELPVWDMKKRELKAEPSIPPNVEGDITTIAFNEIGYTLVAATSGGTAMIWDLRKTAVIQEIDLGAPAQHAEFDHSGKHLLVATDSGIRLYTQKDKKKYDFVVQYQGTKGFRTASFDKLSDDYYLALSKDGVLTNYQCQPEPEMS